MSSTKLTVRYAIASRLFSGDSYRQHRELVKAVKEFVYEPNEELLEGLIRYSQALDALRDVSNFNTKMHSFWPFFRNEMISSQMQEWESKYSEPTINMLHTKWKNEPRHPTPEEYVGMHIGDYGMPC